MIYKVRSSSIKLNVMRYVLPLLLLFLPLHAQNKNNSPHALPVRTSRKAAQVRRTLDMMQELDNMLGSDSANLLHFFQAQDKAQPTQVFLKKDETYEKEFEDEFLLVLDSHGRVRIAIEMPHSLSGDWYLEDRHYFNEEGYLLAYQHKYNRFGGDDRCGESPFHQITEILYSSTSHNPLTIRRTNNDHQGKNISGGCFIFDSGSMRIFPSWHDMARELNLPDAPAVTTPEQSDTH